LVGTPHAEACNSAFRQTLRGKPPDVIRRVALSRVPLTIPQPPVGVCELFNVPQDGVRTFLPSRRCSGGFTPPLLRRNQRSPGPPANSNYTLTWGRKMLICGGYYGDTIPAMKVREAKDFLVTQTAEQAALEGVPLSDLEKRMMYFTESGECPEDPLALNEEFEAEHDSDEYEAKISRLLHQAHRRIRKEGGAARKNWDLAIKCLRRGDHYLLVMWDLSPSTWTPVRDSLKLLASSFGVAALAILAAFVAPKFEPQWRWLQEASQTHWRVLFGIFIAIFLAVLLFPRRVGNAMDWFLDHAFRHFGPREDEKDSD
jgi:hypothetical protein